MMRIFVIMVALLAVASSARATPTQQEVFKSISENVGDQTDGSKLLAVALAVIGAIIFLAVLSHRRQKRVAPAPLNNHNKLLREVLKKSQFKKFEARQLKILSDEQGLSSPLVLLICPSVLAQAMQQRGNAKIDKQVIAQVARKLGVLR